MISALKTGVVLEGPLVGCGGDGYGEALSCAQKGVADGHLLLRGWAEVKGDGGALLVLLS